MKEEDDVRETETEIMEIMPGREARAESVLSGQSRNSRGNSMSTSPQPRQQNSIVR